MLWLHGLYGLYGPRCPLSPERPLNLISHSLQGHFSHDFAIKLLRYGTSCCVCSTACTVLDGFFPYLAQMITSIRGCFLYNDLWLWPVSSWSFNYDFAVKLLRYGTFCHVHSTACTVFGWILSLFWHKWSLAWEGVLIGQWSRSHWLFEFLQSGGGYPSRSLIYNFSSSFPLGTRNLFPEN